MSNSNFVITPATTPQSGIRTLNSIIPTCPFFDTGGNLNMNGLALIGNADSATEIALTSDNTSGTYFIPFSKTTSPTSNALYIDNTTGPLTYNPLSGTLLSQIFFAAATTSTTIFSSLTNQGLEVRNAPSTVSFIKSFEITCSQSSPASTTTITPTSVTSTSFIGTATRATNIAGGLGGQIPYQSSVNTTALLANGNAGQVLTSQGSTLPPSWKTVYTPRIDASGGSPVEFFQNGLQYRCHIFTTAASYTLTVSAISANASFDFCIIGGGGGGGSFGGTGYSGGGGGGALICAFNVPFTTLGNITGTVGAGGSGGGTGTNTTIVLPAPNSTITITASGGPPGGTATGSPVAGGNGGTGYTQVYTTPFNLTLGSSGGGGSNGGTGGTAGGATNSFAKTQFSDMIFGGGRAGGAGVASTAGGGGGGNSGVGGNGVTTTGGAGGAGFALLFDNTLRAVSCGGGGGGSVTGGARGAAGGILSGGIGGAGAGAAGTGAVNTGSGGGGAGTSGGAAGGSGLVMIRYVIG
jgi:hypothetical protein